MADVSVTSCTRHYYPLGLTGLFVMLIVSESLLHHSVASVVFTVSQQLLACVCVLHLHAAFTAV